MKLFLLYPVNHTDQAYCIHWQILLKKNQNIVELYLKSFFIISKYHTLLAKSWLAILPNERKNRHAIAYMTSTELPLLTSLGFVDWHMNKERSKDNNLYTDIHPSVVNTTVWSRPQFTSNILESEFLRGSSTFVGLSITIIKMIRVWY